MNFVSNLMQNNLTELLVSRSNIDLKKWDIYF